MNESQEQHIRMQFDDGESGHGAIVEPGLARIDNIPYTDRLNLSDIVKVERDDGCWIAREVVRRVLPKKTAFDYDPPFKETFATLFDAWRKAGISFEGVFEGLVLVAHRDDQNPMDVAAQAGVTLRLHSPQPELEPVPVP